MFENFYELQTRNRTFEDNLSSLDRAEFNNHRSKVQSMVHFTLTINDFDNFMKNTPAQRKYDNCLYKCHNAINDVEFDSLGKETLRNCTNKCKKSLNAYKDKKLDIFYLLLLFSKRKTLECLSDYRNDPFKLNNCTWLTLNKARRRINNYWPGQLNKYLEAFD